MVLVISHPSNQILFTTSMTMCVDDFVNHILFCSIFGDDGTRSGELLVREKGGVVRDEGFQKAGVEPGKGLRVVGESQCIFGLLRKGFDDDVWAIIMWHEFGDPLFVLVFVVGSL